MTKILEISVFLGLRVELYAVLLIVATPAYIFWRWLFTKYRRNNKSNTLIVLLTTIILTPLIYLGIILLVTYKPDRNFDKTIWAQDKESRYRMSTDLINKNTLMGKDTDVVRKLLGDPNAKPNSKNVINRWFYSLGESNLMFRPIDHNLVIRFTDGKVVANSEFEIEQ